MVNADARKEFIREMMIDSLSKSNKYSKDEIIKQLQRFFAFKLRKEHSEELVDEYNAEIAYLEEKIENLITQNGIDDENDKKAFKEKLPEYKKLEEIKTKLKNVKLSAVEEVQYDDLKTFFELIAGYDDKTAKECHESAYECFVEQYKKAKNLIDKELAKYNVIIAKYLELIDKRQYNKNEELKKYTEYIASKIKSMKSKMLFDDYIDDKTEDQDKFLTDWTAPVPKNFNFGDKEHEFLNKLKIDSKYLTKFTPEQISTLKQDQVAQVITEKSIKYLSKDALKALGPKINAIEIEALKQIDDEVILQNLNADKKKQLIATNPEKYLKLFKTADLNKGDAFAITDTTDVATIKSFLERSTRPLTNDEVSHILLKDNNLDEVVWNILADPKRVPDSVLTKINFLDCKKDKVTKFVQQLGVRVFKLNVDFENPYKSAVMLADADAKIADATAERDLAQAVSVTAKQAKDKAQDKFNQANISYNIAENDNNLKIAAIEGLLQTRRKVDANLYQLQTEAKTTLDTKLSIKHNAEAELKEANRKLTLANNIFNRAKTKLTQVTNDKNILVTGAPVRINILFNLIRNGIRLSEEQYRLFPQDVLNALMDHLYEGGRITVELLNPPIAGGSCLYIGGAVDKIVITDYATRRKIPIQFFVDLKSSINKIEKENLVKLTEQLLQETKDSTVEIYNYNLTPIISNISDKHIINIIAKDDRYKSKLTDNQTFIVDISDKNEKTKAEILQSIQSIGKMIIPSILLYNLIHVTKHVPVEATNDTTYKLHEVLQKVLTSLLVTQKVQQVQQINKKQANNVSQDMSHKVFDTLNNVSILTTIISKLIAHTQSSSHSNNTSSQAVQTISYDARMIDSIRNSLLSTLATSKLQNMVSSSSTGSTGSTRNITNNALPTASVQPIDKTVIDNIFEVILANKIIQLTEPSTDAIRNAVRATTIQNTQTPDINSDIVNSILTTIVSNNAILNLHQSDQLPNAQPPEVQEQNHMNNNSKMTSQLAQVVKTIVIMYHIIQSVSDKSKEETRMIFSKLNDFMPIIANALTTLYNKTGQREPISGGAPPPIPVKKPSTEAPKDKREEKTLANKEDIDYDKILTDLENWTEKLKSVDEINTKLTKVNTEYIEKYNEIKKPDQLETKIQDFGIISPPNPSTSVDLTRFRTEVHNTDLNVKLNEISEAIVKFEDTISSKHIETLLNKVDEYKKIHTDIKSHIESKKHFIPLLTSDELQELKEKLREYLKHIELFINGINEIKNAISETEIKAIKTLVKSISDKLSDNNSFSTNKSNLAELKSKLTKLENGRSVKTDKFNNATTNVSNIKKTATEINTILIKVFEIAKKKSRNPMQKAMDGNSLDDKLTTESVYNSIWNNYLDDLKDNSKLLEKSQDKFYKAFRNKNLDPEDALQLSSDDKILFCIIIFIIRQIALAITEVMIDYGYVNILHNALISYGGFYTLIILIIIIVINFDDYKLRIMFNYFNMHINPSGVIGHIFVVIGLMVLMYFIIYNIDKNVKNQKAAITEIEKMRLIYKLELITIFIFVLVSAITIIS
jgi:hypothetical protein